MVREEFCQESGFALKTASNEFIYWILSCLPSLQHWISWYTVVICRRKQMRLYEWIGLFQHCISEDQEQQIPSSLFCEHSCFWGKEEIRVSTAPILRAKLNSPSKNIKDMTIWYNHIKKNIVSISKSVSWGWLTELFKGKLSLKEGINKDLAAPVTGCTHLSVPLRSRGYDLVLLFRNSKYMPT